MAATNGNFSDDTSREKEAEFGLARSTRADRIELAR